MSTTKPGTMRSRSIRRPVVEVDHGFRWGTLNSVLLAAGVATLVVGYVLLGKGDITMAPMLLVLGYVVLVPASLLLRPRTEAPGE